MSKPPAWLIERLQQRPDEMGRGISASVIDRGFWLNENDALWIRALESLDRSGGKEISALAALLRSAVPLSQDARRYIADLLERYTLAPPKHRPRKPAYDRTDHAAALELGAEEFRQLYPKPRGAARDKAIEQIAEKYYTLMPIAAELECDEAKHAYVESLTKHLTGTRKTTRQMKQRLR